MRERYVVFADRGKGNQGTMWEVHHVLTNGERWFVCLFNSRQEARAKARNENDRLRVSQMRQKRTSK